MTEKEINKLIAKACGWTEIHDSGPRNNDKLWGYPPQLPGSGGNAYKHVPDYCNDLNAMHEALKTLPSDQLWDVAYSLPMETMMGFMSTARDLAETFLLVHREYNPTDKESLTPQLPSDPR